MNTFENLVSNGIEPHTAQYMLDEYSKHIGKMNGVYKITDITFDFSERGKDVTLKCSLCGKEIHRMMISGRNKWSELIKSCPCQKEIKAVEQRLDFEKIQKRKNDMILKRVGEIHGDYKIVSVAGEEDNLRYVMKCEVCGAEKTTYAKTFDRRKNFHCTKHFQREIKFDESYIGKKKNFLTVIGITRLKNGKRAFDCKCDCGNFAKVNPTLWDKGVIKSCGCLCESLKVEHSEELDRLRRIYNGMVQRCCNKKSYAYEYYGGRGITICTEWINDREKFIEWALENGYRNNLTIDRIDVNGNYEPSNCRWATYEVQVKNRRPKWQWKKPKKRKGKTLTISGETKPIREWYEIYNTSGQAVRYRTKVLGMDLEQALQTPKMAHGRPRKS